jgi:glycine cleavage system H protein
MNLPASGTITAANEALSDTPEVVNSDPYGKGWIVKFMLNDPKELDALMDAKTYEAYCNERG